MTESKLSFFKKVLTVAIVLGAVMALASVSYLTVDNLLSRSTLRDHDDYLLKQLSDQDLFTPLEQRIAERENLLPKLKDPLAIREQERKLASLYEELGKRSLNLGQLARAEQNFQKALHLDPGNTSFLTQIANLYATAAQRQSEAIQRMELWRSSTQHWQTAIHVESDPQKKRGYATSAATAAYHLANEFRSVGDRQRARTELLKARDWAPANSSIKGQIDQLLSRL
jgi:tetratricopeptide (TPR) repeat protein